MSPSAHAVPLRGPLAVAPIALVEAGHRLRHRRVRRPFLVGRRQQVAESGDRHVHGAWCDRGDVGVAEAETVHRARLEVLAHDVDFAREPEKEVTPLRVLEVDADAVLAEVVAEIRGADGAAVARGHRGDRRAPRLADPRVLDLDDLGAHAREQLRGEREGLLLLDREDADSGERCGAHGTPAPGMSTVTASSLADRMRAASSRSWVVPVHANNVRRSSPPSTHA